MSAARAPLRLDASACDRCGRCISACDPRVIRLGPNYISVDWTGCDGCGKCARLCATGAISLAGTEPRAIPDPPPPARAAPAPRAVAAGPAVRRPKDHALASAIPWSLGEAAAVLVVAFALLVVAQSFVADLVSAPWSGLALMAHNAVLFALLWYLARRHGADPVSAYRVNTWPEWTSALLAVVVGAACWLFSVTYRAVVLAAGLQPGTADGPVLTRLFGPGAVGATLTFAIAALIGPLLEELLLRGVVLSALRARVGDLAGVLVCALIFAVLHASLWSLLPLTVLGIGLGWLATRSRSLWPAIVAHVLYNAVLIGAAFYAAAR